VKNREKEDSSLEQGEGKGLGFECLGEKHFYKQHKKGVDKSIDVYRTAEIREFNQKNCLSNCKCGGESVTGEGGQQKKGAGYGGNFCTISSPCVWGGI